VRPSLLLLLLLLRLLLVMANFIPTNVFKLLLKAQQS
jgi:hypothetical protein